MNRINERLDSLKLEMPKVQKKEEKDPVRPDPVVELNWA